jgi:manganese/iron transport system substrate-binding protein
MPRLRPAVPALALLAALTACGGSAASGAADDAGRLDVVATTTQLQDFVRVVGGDRVDLTGILRPGVAAHDVSPTPADLVALGEADVLVENGLGLEHWLDSTVTSSGFDGIRVDASEGVEVRTGAEEPEHAEEPDDAEHADEPEHTSGDGHDHDGADPHIWQSPLNAIVMVGNVADGLAEADPANATAYRANAEAYVEELRALDAEVEAALAPLPDKRVVTNHDAFGYYLDRYGLEFVGSVIPSFDSSAELSGAEVTALVGRIRQSGTTAVFSETSLPPDTAETVGREAGVTVVAGSDALYGDSLGQPGSDAATYVDMIRHNTRVFVEALGG